MDQNEFALMFLANGWITVDAENGIVYRTRDRFGNTLDPPEAVNKIGKTGYIFITLSDVTLTGKCQTKGYGAHRIVWIAENGPIPPGLVIDHINRVRHDNRIANLRCVTTAENNRNKSRRKPKVKVVPAPPLPKYVRPKYIADQLSIDVQTVYRAIYSGELPSYRFNKRTILIAIDDAQAWIDANTSSLMEQTA